MYVAVSVPPPQRRRLYVRVAYSRGHTLVAFVYVVIVGLEKRRESWTELCRLCSCMKAAASVVDTEAVCRTSLSECATPAMAAWLEAAAAARSLCSAEQRERGMYSLIASFVREKNNEATAKESKRLGSRKDLVPFYSDVDGPARKLELKIVPQKSIPDRCPKKHIF